MWKLIPWFISFLLLFLLIYNNSLNFYQWINQFDSLIDLFVFFTVEKYYFRQSIYLFISMQFIYLSDNFLSTPQSAHMKSWKPIDAPCTLSLLFPSLSIHGFSAFFLSCACLFLYCFSCFLLLFSFISPFLLNFKLYFTMTGIWLILTRSSWWLCKAMSIFDYLGTRLSELFANT